MTIHRSIILSLLLLAALAVHAQQLAFIEQEHRYQFQMAGEVSPQTEKVLLESMSGFDPAMRVNIDRPTQLMHVLAYRPLDPQAVVALATQFGVALTYQRPRTEGTANVPNQ